MHTGASRSVALRVAAAIAVATAAAVTFHSQASAAGAQANPAAAGEWQGAIGTPPPLGVSVHLAVVDGVWEGTIDIPAQGAFGIPLTGIEVDDESVRFVIADVPGEATFEGTIEADTVAGTFSQAGQTFPFELERLDAELDDTAAPEAAAPADAAAAPGPGPAPVDPAAVPADPAERYEDPDGVFAVPVPAGWTVEEDDVFAAIVSPEGGIHLYLVTVADQDLEAAVAEAWARVDPDFELETTDVLEPPSSPGVERTVVVNYDSPTGQVHQAIAQLHDGVTHVFLVDAALEAAQRRGPQIDIVFTGYQILALEDPDLTDVEPRAVREVTEELAAFVRDALDAFGIPGAAIAIVEDGDVVYAEGFGVRNAAGDAMSPDTHMMIGSTGKTITTLLMAALVGEGAFDWETRVVEVLPEFEVADPELTETMVMWHLVCACSGVPRRDLELLFNADDMAAEDVVASLATFEFFTDFGEVFQYSNQLVGTGGYAAAAADGAAWGELFEGYADSLTRHVLEPIGMQHTTLSFDQVAARGEHGLPHQLDLATGAYVEVPLEVERLLVPIAPAGSHWSTANDMARYMITQMNAGVAPDSTRVAPEAAVRETWQPRVPVTATDSYGLGWFVGEYRGLDLLHHAGNTLGFTSDFAFLPEAGLGIVVLTNGQGTTFFNSAVRTRLFELVYDQPAQSEELVAFGATQIAAILEDLAGDLLPAVDEDAVTPYLGTFASAALGTITLELVEGALMLDAGEFRTELRPSVDAAGEVDSYVAMEGPVAGAPFEFEEEDGEAVIVLGEGLVAYTFTRLE